FRLRHFDFRLVKQTALSGRAERAGGQAVRREVPSLVGVNDRYAPRIHEVVVAASDDLLSAGRSVDPEDGPIVPAISEILAVLIHRVGIAHNQLAEVIQRDPDRSDEVFADGDDLLIAGLAVDVEHHAVANGKIAIGGRHISNVNMTAQDGDALRALEAAT